MSQNNARALFLSALVVTSLFAGTVALTGSAVAASGVEGGSVSPTSTEEGQTESYDVSFTVTDVNTNDSTTGATANVSFAAEFDLSGASVSGESIGPNATVTDVTVDADSNVVSLAWDDDAGVDTEDLDVTLTVDGVTTTDTNGAAEVTATVDGDADDTFEVSETTVGTVDVAASATVGGVEGGTVAPDNTTERHTESYDVSFTMTGANTGDGTTGATANVSFAAEFDLSGASVGGESIGPNATVTDVTVDADSNVVSLAWDDDAGVDTEDLDVALTVDGVTTTGTDSAAEVTATVDGDADGTAEVSETVGTVDVGELSRATDASEYDDVVDSDSTRWVGQDLFLMDPNGANETYSLERVDSDGNRDGLSTEIPLDSNGEATVSTSNLDDDDVTDYVVVDEDDQPVVFDDSGVATGTGTVSDARFSVVDQDFEAEFDDSEVSNAGEETNRTLELDSNRGSYTVEIYADGLEAEELEGIFGGTTGENDDGDEYVALEGSTATELDADFTDVDPDTYNFTVEVADTGDTAEASVEVVERDADRDIVQSVVRDHAGDEVEFTVDLESTDDAVVFVGGPDVNMLERVVLEDGDDDDQIVFRMNTFRAGRDPSAVDGMDDIEDAYTSEDDDVVEVTRPRSPDGTGDTATTTTDGVDNESDLGIDANLGAPMTDGTYDVLVSSTTRVDGDDDEVVVPDEQDAAVLHLRPGEFRSVTPLIAPHGADVDDRGDLLDSTTESETVAERDQLVLEVEAEGIGGYVDEDAADLQNNNGLYLAVRQAEPGANRDPRVVDLDHNAAELVADEDNDTYYVVLDTGRWEDARDGTSLDNERYTVELALTGDDTDLYDDLEDWYGSGSYSSSSYLDGDESRTVESSVTVEPRDAHFPAADDGTLSVAQYEESRVAASTNLAPGSEVLFRLSSENYVFSESAEVQDNGTVEVLFDTSEPAVGTTMTASVRASGETLGRTDAEIVERTTPTETTFETTTSTAETTTSTAETTTSTTATTTVGTDPSPTEDDGPGFGAAVAVVALLAAALLAVRRDD